MREVRIMRGLPGSGKSTRAKAHAAVTASTGHTWAIVSMDQYFTADDGSYEFKPNRLTEAHRDCYQRFIYWLELGTNVVIVDNTNVRYEEFELYVRVAKLAGYSVVYDQVKPKDAAEIEMWHARCVHGIPLEKMRRRAAQWQDVV